MGPPSGSFPAGSPAAAALGRPRTIFMPLTHPTTSPGDPRHIAQDLREAVETGVVQMPVRIFCPRDSAYLLSGGVGGQTMKLRPVLVFIVLAALLQACSGIRVPFRPVADESGTCVVKYAYFSTVTPPGGYMDGNRLPAGYTEFYPDDPRITFITAFWLYGKGGTAKIILRRPDGTPHRWFSQIFKPSPYNVTYHYWELPWASPERGIADLRSFPGQWTVDLLSDDVPVGSYKFWLGDPATIARLKQNKSVAVDAGVVAGSQPCPLVKALQNLRGYLRNSGRTDESTEILVLGRHPDYLNVTKWLRSQGIRARALNITKRDWKLLEKEGEEWEINKAIIGESIGERSPIIFSNDAADPANLLGTFGKEVQLLKDLGYRITPYIAYPPP